MIESVETVVCGRIDARYGECLEGTYHAVKGGYTLCGQSAAHRETKVTIWWGRSVLRSQESIDEAVTCQRCRKSLGLAKRPGGSRVLL